MGETGKRNRNNRNVERDGGSAQKRRWNSSSSNNNKEGGGDGELVVYRILCPNPLMGGVIGKGGKVINSIRNETRAKVKVVDPFPGSDNRILTVYCYVRDKDIDEMEDRDGDDDTPLCAAQDALLRLHDAILAAKSNQLDSSDDGDKVECRVLVPGSQAANVIGKGGATIKRLRSKTGANIRVNPKDPNDPAHSCAMGFDNFVVITGEEDSVKKALYAVSAIMYKFSPREEISLDTSVPETLPSIIVPPDVPIYPAGGLYSSVDPIGHPQAIPPVVGPPPSVPEYAGYADTVGSWPGYSSAVPVVPPSGPSKSEDLVLKVLCPGDKIGRVIGKGGGSIKSVRQASGAHIDVDDANRGGECVIMVTSAESTNDMKSSAVEAVLLLQEKINDEDEERINMRLLVPKSAVGCLIGKGGSIANEMRKTSRAEIRISKGEKPRCASAEDELVELFGEVSNVRDALVQIILKLRDDALRDRDSGRNGPHQPEPAYTSSYSVPPAVPAIPPASSLGYDQRGETGRGMGMLSGGSLYGYGSLQGGDNGYGSLSSYGPNSFGGLPPFEMVIPATAIGKVLGKSGANLANIRKISGANIEILESKSSRSERIAQISGTQEQMRSAENLIHAFIMAT